MNELDELKNQVKSLERHLKHLRVALVLTAAAVLIHAIVQFVQ